MSNSVISIIDDDANMRGSLTALMRSARYDVESFPSAEDFLASGTASRFNCIISDIRMPGLSGIDLKRKLNADHCITPVIFVTAQTDEEIAATALNLGATCLLRKPFKAEALFSCVKRALNPVS